MSMGMAKPGVELKPRAARKQAWRLPFLGKSRQAVSCRPPRFTTALGPWQCFSPARSPCSCLTDPCPSACSASSWRRPAPTSPRRGYHHYRLLLRDMKETHRNLVRERQIAQLNSAIIGSFAMAIDAKDQHSQGHTEQSGHRAHDCGGNGPWGRRPRSDSHGLHAARRGQAGGAGLHSVETLGAHPRGDAEGADARAGRGRAAGVGGIPLARAAGHSQSSRVV